MLSQLTQKRHLNFCPAGLSYKSITVSSKSLALNLKNKELSYQGGKFRWKYIFLCAWAKEVYIRKKGLAEYQLSYKTKIEYLI